MTEVLRHEATVAEAALVLPVAVRPLDATLHSLERRNGSNGSKGSNGTNGSGPHAELAVLPSGSRPANAPAVLASDRLIEVLDELKEHYDVVVIDSAPLLAVTDTVPLLRYADGALFVGRLDVTTRDTAKRLMQFLERVPQLRLLGVVANDLSRLEASGYGYGYGYGYGAYREELPDDRRSRFAGRFGRPKQPV
jgi:Mrp family chromosome partitioning ATPase